MEMEMEMEETFSLADCCDYLEIFASLYNDEFGLAVSEDEKPGPVVREEIIEAIEDLSYSDEKNYIDYKMDEMERDMLKGLDFNYVFTTNRTDSWCDFLIPFGFPVIFERITFPPSENQVNLIRSQLGNEWALAISDIDGFRQFAHYFRFRGTADIERRMIDLTRRRREEEDGKLKLRCQTIPPSENCNKATNSESDTSEKIIYLKIAEDCKDPVMRRNIYNDHGNGLPPLNQTVMASVNNFIPSQSH